MSFRLIFLSPSVFRPVYPVIVSVLDYYGTDSVSDGKKIQKMETREGLFLFRHFLYVFIPNPNNHKSTMHVMHVWCGYTYIER